MDKLLHQDCLGALLPIRDAMEVINGKWKLQILISILGGNKRFKAIERSIPGITGKVLTKELKDLEAHELISRIVYDKASTYIEYKTTDYAQTLQPVFLALLKWGKDHRKRIMRKQ
ncbi:helix-turn-helix domain-containing protein [Chitinophaga sp. Cy-1792]|uniref:winged helix-turn-helix transcriptional regulator n=1 Tax=Chitinophaga sp. Cy-1792 TaxID=2608339 RepID=UPI001420520D|nr:helix-turn-helix domain-containing protein [Chitinophaga sp. Cy-1792]NIG54553.1 helix-turn-helix transcriptional regulator [Chitinophaga sp. Cy-1792]